MCKYTIIVLLFIFKYSGTAWMHSNLFVSCHSRWFYTWMSHYLHTASIYFIIQIDWQELWLLYWWWVVNMNSTFIVLCFSILLGGAGTGKSHLITSLHQMAERTLQCEGESPEEIKIWLTAPTGCVAYNIGVITLHAAFLLPINRGKAYIRLSETNETRWKWNL